MEKIEFFIKSDPNKKTIHNCTIGTASDPETEKVDERMREDLLKPIINHLRKKLKKENIGYRVIDMMPEFKKRFPDMSKVTITYK
jgi:hypothetical protein